MKKGLKIEKNAEILPKDFLKVMQLVIKFFWLCWRMADYFFFRFRPHNIHFRPFKQPWKKFWAEISAILAKFGTFFSSNSKMPSNWFRTLPMCSFRLLWILKMPQDDFWPNFRTFWKKIFPSEKSQFPTKCLGLT